MHLPKMSTKRRESAKRLKNADGVTVCSCGCGRIPKPPRQTWFSAECVDKWREKNDPAYIRQLLKKRDKGICAACGCDSEKVYAEWCRARAEVSRLADRLIQGYRRNLAWQDGRWVFANRNDDSYDWKAQRDYREELLAKYAPAGNWTAGRSTAWDADHILEVVNGGGLCGLDNYQTLCHPCHKAKTAKLARERAEQRRRDKLIQAGDMFAALDTRK